MSAFEIIPAIDLKEGRCVRLVQGRKDQVTVYGDDPVAVAREFERLGARRLHVVDLDGAFDGRPRNLEHLLDIVKGVGIPVQTGGGIRSVEAAKTLLDEGIDRVIFGTVAVRSPELVAEACERFGPDRVVVGLDARNGMVAVSGWVEDSDIPAFDLALKLKELGVGRIVYTDIARDGMLTGPNLPELKRMLETGLSVIASGGVASLADLEAIAALHQQGVSGAIVGKAIYTGDVDLGLALRRIDALLTER